MNTVWDKPISFVAKRNDQLEADRNYKKSMFYASLEMDEIIPRKIGVSFQSLLHNKIYPFFINLPREVPWIRACAQEI